MQTQVEKSEDADGDLGLSQVPFQKREKEIEREREREIMKERAR